MSNANYQSKWWGYIFDQMMEQDLPETLAAHRLFYRLQPEGLTGPVLEGACGTGLFFLPLLAAGHDMYGIDISTEMLAAPKRKAEVQGFEDIEGRISLQDFQAFRYERPFDAIIIPTNSFLMLTR
jgi:SAM-dependent methyltransferase